MRKSLLSTAAASLMLVAGVSGASAMPNRFKAMERGLKNSPCMQKVPGSFLQKTVDANGIVTPDFTLTATYVQEMFPTGWLLSPTGETWFYTLETEGTPYRPEGWLPNWNFSGFKLTVYNGLGQPTAKSNFPKVQDDATTYCLKLSSPPHSSTPTRPTLKS